MNNIEKIIATLGGYSTTRKEASVRFSLSPQTSERRSEVGLIDIGGDSYGK